MTSIFSKIINGDIPGAFVYQDELCAVFLDAEPMTDGHALVVPREEIDHWIDLPDDLAAHLMAVAQRIGRAQQSAFDCKRIGVLIQGYEVPHVHIHVWPTNSVKEFDPAIKGPMAEPEALKANAEKIIAALG